MPRRPEISRDPKAETGLWADRGPRPRPNSSRVSLEGTGASPGSRLVRGRANRTRAGECRRRALARGTSGGRAASAQLAVVGADHPHRPAGNGDPPLDPVVEQAMLDLTMSLNHNNPLLGSYDKAEAITALQACTAAATILTRSTSKRGRSRTTGPLRRQLASGSAPKGSAAFAGYCWRADIFDYWKKKASARSLRRGRSRPCPRTRGKTGRART